MHKTVQADSRIRWRYQLFLADGYRVESSTDPAGDILQLGQRRHPNLENARWACRKVKTRLIILADQAFGQQTRRHPDAATPSSRLTWRSASADHQPCPPSGQKFRQNPAMDADNVSVDFNHPLAGHNISFELEIMEIY